MTKLKQLQADLEVAEDRAKSMENDKKIVAILLNETWAEVEFGETWALFNAAYNEVKAEVKRIKADIAQLEKDND